MACTKMASISNTGSINATNRSSYSIPEGMIFPYAGKIPPAGYVFCDGSNGTPDMRYRVPIGKKDNVALNTNIGSDTHTLSIDELPSHTHKLNIRGDVFNYSTHVDFYPLWWRSVSSQDCEKGGNYSRLFHTGGVQQATLNKKTGKTGGGKPHENRQPFMYLNFIMKKDKSSVRCLASGGIPDRYKNIKSTGVFRYQDNTIYHYPNPTIAQKHDPAWRNAATVDCTNFYGGDPLS